MILPFAHLKQPIVIVDSMTFKSQKIEFDKKRSVMDAMIRQTLNG
jgi:hypothetical protein